jgi:Zn-dependent membrane protease YugP
MLFDPKYIFFVMIPALVLTLFAQWWVKNAFKSASQIANRQRITGAQAARYILDSAGLNHIVVQPTQPAQMVRYQGASPDLDDHYDPREKVLRLSPSVYGEPSIAAMAVAAHEAGHAIQDAQGYAPMRWRSALVPAASIGTNFGVWMIILGVVLQFTGLAYLGLAGFALGVLFSLLTLPVELNASSRAMQLLTSTGMVDQAEHGQAQAVLRAAAFTYVAGLAVALLNLLYWASIVMGMGRSRN